MEKTAQTEKTAHGKFRYESHKTKGGRIYIPSKITKNNSFPFKNNDSVHITLSVDGYIILENYRNMRIEPVNIPYKVSCSIKDCVNKIDMEYGYCIPKIDKVGKIICFILNKDVAFRRIKK